MQSKDKTGGSAFPFTPREQPRNPDGTWIQNWDCGDSGMSLLDYFAARADFPWNVLVNALELRFPDKAGKFTFTEIINYRVELKYAEARAMLAERERTGT